MGIDVPELDDRSYEEYIESAKKLIPAYSDEWTDFNPHDPGITILEVLAWVTETHAYQLDQITDDHREKYLELLGYSRRHHQSSRARLTLEPPDRATGTRLPAGTGLVVTEGVEDTYRFQTDHDLVCTAASLERVVTSDGTTETDNSQENRTEGMFYRAFGDTVEAGDTLYLGFDRDPFATAAALTLTVDYHDEDLPAPAGDGGSFEPSVELEWEYQPPDSDNWSRLDVVADGTDSLYDGGAIELALADEWRFDHGDSGPSSGVTWLRCRVARAGYEIPPQLNRIEPNVVTASHRSSVESERLEQVTSLGEPTALDGQRYEFEQTPVRTADIAVDGEPFVEVSDFDASGPTDRHYRLDRTAGTVTFGDGQSGARPPAGATVTADYVYGGGTEGNVSPTAVWQFEEPSRSLSDTLTLGDIEIAATTAATGGTDQETVTEALERARRDLRTPHRGVTLADYEAIASRTPGLRVGGVNVLVDDEAVTVVVVPYAPPDVPTPTPSEGFLRAVRRHVSRRATLGDRVAVTGPTYVGLDVTVTGTVQERVATDGYEADIRAAVESYVHPLIGADGDGWPFGRPLETDALADRIAALDGIDHVADVTVTAHGGTTVDGRVVIDDEELFAVADVSTELTEVRDSAGGQA